MHKILYTFKIEQKLDISYIKEILDELSIIPLFIGYDNFELKIIVRESFSDEIENYIMKKIYLN